MIAPYVGMSLYTWTAIIAVVLGGLSVGHWIGGAPPPPARRVAPPALPRVEHESMRCQGRAPCSHRVHLSSDISTREP